MDYTDYGVCRLSVVPVRAAAADTSAQTTQLLFGEHYEVTEQTRDRAWLRVRIAYDQYEGWLDARQHHSVSREYFDYLSRAEFKITTDLTASILYNKSPIPILIGSIIPISSSELFKMEEQFAFNGDAKNLGQKREPEFFYKMAYKYLNAPYQGGGRSPFGIDASGFTQMVAKLCGYTPLRDAWQQANQGRAVKSFQERKTGDLFFFKDAEGRIVHTGIFQGGEKIIHASGRVRIDAVEEGGIVDSETKQLTYAFAHIRRILPD